MGWCWAMDSAAKEPHLCHDLIESQGRLFHWTACLMPNLSRRTLMFFDGIHCWLNHLLVATSVLWTSGLTQLWLSMARIFFLGVRTKEVPGFSWDTLVLSATKTWTMEKQLKSSSQFLSIVFLCFPVFFLSCPPSVFYLPTELNSVLWRCFGQGVQDFQQPVVGQTLDCWPADQKTWRFASFFLFVLFMFWSKFWCNLLELEKNARTLRFLPCRCGRSCCNKRGVMRSKKGWKETPGFCGAKTQENVGWCKSKGSLRAKQFFKVCFGAASSRARCKFLPKVSGGQNNWILSVKNHFLNCFSRNHYKANRSSPHLMVSQRKVVQPTGLASRITLFKAHGALHLRPLQHCGLTQFSTIQEGCHQAQGKILEICRFWRPNFARLVSPLALENWSWRTTAQRSRWWAMAEGPSGTALQTHFSRWILRASGLESNFCSTASTSCLGKAMDLRVFFQRTFQRPRTCALEQHVPPVLRTCH